MNASQRSHRARAGLLLSTAGLSLWAGGLLFLGAVVAPHVFFHAGLDRTQAGAVMAPVFLAFDRWIVALAALLVLGEMLRLPAVRAKRPALALHAALLVALLGAAVAGSFFTSPGIEALRLQGAHRGEGPLGRRLDDLHHRSEALGRAQVLLCAGLLLTCWTQTGDSE